MAVGMLAAVADCIRRSRTPEAVPIPVAVRMDAEPELMVGALVADSLEAEDTW